ncbi:uncharacterized protein LOC130675768 [Microplitis mediator]|uniref:uncharacterized protein LOC130675768 n=1 Tax=Microplitis mediator TaxID=375433 RepID=UPI0025556C67|nr:uncharacterized protein LOC130675768 [Microplitis mediator]
MEPVSIIYYDDDYFAAARNLIHYGIAVPRLSERQKELAEKIMRFGRQPFLQASITPGTAEWKLEVELMFRQQLTQWRRQWAERTVPEGCARCTAWGHTARECTNPPAQIKPFCDECVGFFDTDICHGPHGRARLAARGRCMVCCRERVVGHRCQGCRRTISEQLWALERLPKFTWDRAVILKYRLDEW